MSFIWDGNEPFSDSVIYFFDGRILEENRFNDPYGNDNFDSKLEKYCFGRSQNLS